MRLHQLGVFLGTTTVLLTADMVRADARIAAHPERAAPAGAAAARRRDRRPGNAIAKGGQRQRPTA